MPRATREHFQLTIAEQGLVPVYSNSSIEICCAVMKACYDAGARFFELTNRVKNAPEIFAQLVRFRDEHCPGMILGVGTIWFNHEADPFLEAGADFVVGPNT